MRNYSGKAIIRCSLYQHNTDEDNKPHAHRLVKKFGNDEVDDPHDIEIAEEDGYVAWCVCEKKLQVFCYNLVIASRIWV